jgi:preprotein translocase subunit SecD
MDRIWKWKLILLVVVTIGASLYVTPSLMNWDTETVQFPVKKKVNLGLDLQGGLYMIFGIDMKKLFKDTLDRQVESLRKEVETDGVTLTHEPSTIVGLESDDPRAMVTGSDLEKIKTKIKDDFVQLSVLAERDGKLEVGMSWNFRKEVRLRTVEQSIKVVRNRIDEFGVTEPTIVSQGTDRLVVELPGVKDVERAKALVGRTAKLEFRIVDDNANLGKDLESVIKDLETAGTFGFKEGDRLSAYVEKVNEAAKGKLPENTEIAFERPDKNSAMAGRLIPYLIEKKADVSGEDLSDAVVQYGDDGLPVVSFTMHPGGAKRFGDLTKANTKRRMAIVLDGLVHSAPVINEPITQGRGQISLGRGNAEDVMKEARDLSIVLRAGALPAQMDLLEQRAIGPTLGADSIKKGVLSGVVGCVLVFLFMIIYYRLSGVIATVSLMLNVLFVFAILVMLGATLTLPGIAGLALTIGMAVDSNVIIFERIRDELREGASVRRAVEQGFDRAFACIFDANITHGIVALILMKFGTGPIRGFAVTLMIGIFTTLFCAVTVAKFLFDWYLGPKNKSELTKISI